MAKKILLNIFFNIAIFTLILCSIWLFNHQHYALLLATVFALALFVYFKIRLIKDVREMRKKR